MEYILSKGGDWRGKHSELMCYRKAFLQVVQGQYVLIAVGLKEKAFGSDVKSGKGFCRFPKRSTLTNQCGLYPRAH